MRARMRGARARTRSYTSRKVSEIKLLACTLRHPIYGMCLDYRYVIQKIMLRKSSACSGTYFVPVLTVLRLLSMFVPVLTVFLLKVQKVRNILSRCPQIFHKWKAAFFICEFTTF